ncbi:MAG: tRNA lysidine(34) synthetase TilS [candidate division KSB1 bacterium]|nr:tRNA lysidine(34) synthetase TilS [candidate division KSB1 bacterium]MDZ7301470.1 tRNA lysidine(34) synthetase TilS [candidate division KSB1 bacterium]
MKRKMDLLRQFRQHCTARHLVRPGDRLLLAVSGGLDSCVLLDLFCQLRQDWQLQLAVGHVNHQLRGSEADADEAFVKRLAEAAGLPFFSQRVEVSAFAQAQKLSLEMAARKLRYHALEKFRSSWLARAIVTAHTLDDQAETILDHLLRGCGLAGLAGMSACADLALDDLPADASSAADRQHAQQVKVLRPLLPFSRAQIEAHARIRGLHWREDRTNTDPQFRRNRIRHELMPLLRTRFNPKIAQSLERLSSIAGSADFFFRNDAEARLAEVIKEKHQDKIVLDLEQFWKYFPIVQVYVIRAVMRILAAQDGEPTFSETARILALLQASDDTKWPFKQHAAAGVPGEISAIGKRFIWRKRIEILVDHDGAVFREVGVAPLAREEGRDHALPLDSAIRVEIGERCPIPGATRTLLVERKALPLDWRRQVNPCSQFVDAEKVQGELHLRFPQPGDRFVPLRSGCADESVVGSKKLSDFFTDLKVPLHRRHTTPVLECGDDIIWICGYRIDDRFKITPATRVVLHLQLLS